MSTLKTLNHILDFAPSLFNEIRNLIIKKQVLTCPAITLVGNKLDIFNPAQRGELQSK